MSSPFHPGEREVQRRAGLAEEASRVGGIIARDLTPAIARFLARQRLAVAASLDAAGRVWASLLTGPAGFLAPAGPRRLRIAASPIAGDPLGANLGAGGRPELGLVVLDPRTRQRMRVNGIGRLDDHGVQIEIRQVYGNCPKYIQLRESEADVPPTPSGPSAPRVAASLDAHQRGWIAAADTLFIASFHPEGGADASHRGGRPGFVRVLGSDRLAFPDYPGNAMFNTLGNLVEYPRAGLLFVDFTSGDVLQLTAAARLEHDRSVVFDIEEARETAAASPLRFRLVEYSPANPPLSQEAPPRHRITNEEEIA
jgi:predicted pyridoxine 5'-phosphate oxidase superfamily flavin-nucleotide-binding protein